MNYNLENEYLKIDISDQGAEMHSILGKKENVEFLWNGDHEYWGYHAPVLFPIIGKVQNNTYKVDETEYSLPQHGLARISKFVKTSQSKSDITFELDYSDETLKVYPFKFTLEVKYTLDKNIISIEYKVINKDKKNILFSIGAHPAFMCPLFTDEELSDYYFKFSEKETATTTEFSPQGYLVKNEIPYLNNENIIPLTQETFKNDALVFHDLKSHTICLKSKNHDQFIEVDFTGFPYLGLWSKTTGAPFVCIEPWHGHADYQDFKGEFKDKEGIISLEKKNEFVCSYTLKINQ